MFMKSTDRTRTHFFGAGGDVGEETAKRLDYTPDCCVNVVCSWSWVEVVLDLVQISTCGADIPFFLALSSYVWVQLSMTRAVGL